LIDCLASWLRFEHRARLRYARVEKKEKKRGAGRLLSRCAAIVASFTIELLQFYNRPIVYFIVFRTAQLNLRRAGFEISEELRLILTNIEIKFLRGFPQSRKRRQLHVRGNGRRRNYLSVHLKLTGAPALDCRCKIFIPVESRRVSLSLSLSLVYFAFFFILLLFSLRTPPPPTNRWRGTAIS